MVSIPLWAEELYKSVDALWQAHEETLIQAPVVLIGERHTEAAHHESQLRLIQKLAAHNPLSVGLEALGSDQQPVLEAYLRGDLDEEGFLRKSDWFDRWGYDFRLMAPLFRYAKSEAIPLFALNFPDSKHRRLLDQNSSGDLDEALLRSMPPKRREKLTALHGRHPGSGDLERFLRGQQLWEAQMATRAAEHHERHRDRQLVILAGNGHLGRAWGVGAKLERLGLKGAVAIIQDANRSLPAHLHLDPPPSDRCLSPVLGVFFDQELTVLQVMEGSLAQKLDLRAGDRLTALNEKEVSKTAQVRWALYQAAALGQVALEVVREGERLTVTHRFDPCLDTPAQ